MRKIIITGLVASAALGLSACSQEAQDKTGEAANAIGNDVENGAQDAGNAIEAGTQAAGDSLDSAGNKIENGADSAANNADDAAARTEADIQNTTVQDAKND